MPHLGARLEAVGSHFIWILAIILFIIQQYVGREPVGYPVPSEWNLRKFHHISHLSNR